MGLGICNHRLGLLVLRDCGLPAIVSCLRCSRPVCSLHLRDLEGKSLCILCYRTFQGNEYDEYEYDDWVDGCYEDDHSPFYYGESEAYGEEDFESFEADESFSDDFDAGDFADS